MAYDNYILLNVRLLQKNNKKEKWTARANFYYHVYNECIAYLLHKIYITFIIFCSLL